MGGTVAVWRSGPGTRDPGPGGIPEITGADAVTPSLCAARVVVGGERDARFEGGAAGFAGADAQAAAQGFDALAHAGQAVAGDDGAAAAVVGDAQHRLAAFHGEAGAGAARAGVALD